MRCLIAFVLLTACSDEGSYSINISFDSTSLQERVTRIRMRVLFRCETTLIAHDKDFLWNKDGDERLTLGGIEPGRYSLDVIGYEVRADEVCEVAHFCAEQTFEAGGTKTVLVKLDELRTPICVSTADAGDEPDASEPDTGTCIAQEEVCNNEDDDCDGDIDEETDKETDRQHCGSCNNSCAENKVCGGTDCVDPIVQIAPGGKYTCARRVNGQVLCWGDNTYGQLGDGTSQMRLLPTPIVGVADAKDLGAGKFHACALREEGEVMCWGENSSGQIAENFGSTIPTPAAVKNIDPVVSLGLGFYHVCAVVAGGDVFCWGSNGGGQLGRPFFNETDFQRRPVAVPDVHDAVQVDGGWRFTCARHSNDTVSCWGNNDHGQLGDGTSTNRIEARSVETAAGAPLTDVVGMAVGLDHVCVVQRAEGASAGTILCWGGGEHGQLGDGRAEVMVRRPVSSGIADAVEVAIGSWFTCARSANGRTRCWGENDWGQLGDGTTTQRNIPTDVFGLSNGSRLYIDNGDYHSCAMTDDLEVICWGRNETGQLGTGTTTMTELRPVRARRL